MIYIKFYDGSADESALARALLDEALMREYGKTASDFEMEISPGGKPYFKNSDIYFNISHTKKAVAVALSESPVGVDIQYILPYSDRLAGRICIPSELDIISASEDKSYELCRMWAMRESYVKYTGEGIRSSIKDIPCAGKSHTYRINGNYVLSVSPSAMEYMIIG